MAKMFLLSVFDNRQEIVDYQESQVDFLEWCYKKLDCDLIEFSEIEITEKGKTYHFDVICDEEGLCKLNAVSVVNSNDEPQLVGSILITHCNRDDKFSDLTDEEIRLIKRHLMMVIMQGRNEKPFLTAILKTA